MRRHLCSALPEVTSVRVPSRFEEALVSGGDDRSALTEQNRNKYNVSPWPLDGEALFRGSCTCNPPTQRAYEAAEAAFRKFEAKEVTYAELTAGIRGRVKRAFDLPAGTGVLLCPSGSDAEFLPVAIAQALKPAGRIGNVVSQHLEIGAGSAPAAGLRYFSATTPLGSKPVDIDAKVCATLDVERFVVPARDADGNARNSSGDVAAFVRDFLRDDDDVVVVHSVLGGKTGLRDAPILTSTENVLGVVDACQGRNTNAELREWLEHRGNVVLATGSKFYRGPPFSGAVLVPASLMATLADKEAPALLSHLSEFLCPEDLPRSLPSWRRELSSNKENLGLALRWEAALAEIEASSAYSADLADDWARRVRSVVDRDFADELSVFESNRCILSLRLRPAPAAPFFDTKALRTIYDWMALDLSHRFPDDKAVAATVAGVGQPVQVSATTGVLRLALGVDSFDHFANDPHAALHHDAAILAKLALLARHYHRLVL